MSERRGVGWDGGGGKEKESSCFCSRKFSIYRLLQACRVEFVSGYLGSRVYFVIVTTNQRQFLRVLLAGELGLMFHEA